MIRRVKWWIYLAILFGGSLFGSGCLGFDGWGGWGGNASILWAVLREDLFS